jgi:hypothetical protein
MKKYLILLTLLLTSCVTTKEIRVGYEVTLPEKPKSVVMESSGIDKNKYPNTKWIKPPVVDNVKGTATWSFSDVAKLSDNLTEWPQWANTVEEIVNRHNALVRKNIGDGKKWYNFWGE